jgi:cytochrome c oxidase subunit 2
VMTRRMLAAGTIPNDAGHLVAWIQSPQGIKPGSLMPDQFLSAEQLVDVRAYLESLR